ncbi:MAG: iron-containing alcohol dehydrogenase [Rhodospirillaceae bacterium]|nr:iron-containing alcohol dehydrogenase [Rhodospirillaceae bacterium]
MADSFQFDCRGSVVSGVGTARQPPAGVAIDGPVLAVVDPGLVGAGVAAPVLEGWQAAGLAITAFTDFSSDPKAAQIDAAREAALKIGATAVLGIGGGSALDVAKTAAALIGSDAAAVDYALCRIPFPARTAALVAIPTTAGTGAEVTRTTVYSDADGAKLWAWDDALRPDVAVLDPEVTVGLPPKLTAATGADALVHAIEACTNRRANPIVDAWALHAIRLVVHTLPVAVRQPQDLSARGTLLVAACLAGLAIDACGTGVAHALGHALGSLAGIHHGRSVALGLRVALPGNAAAAPERHAAVSLAMGLIGEDDMQLATALASRFDAFLGQVGVEISLAEDGLGPADAERLTQAVLRPENAPMCEANCREMTPEVVAELVHALLTAD